jgi:hypothetical protein
MAVYDNDMAAFNESMKKEANPLLYSTDRNWLGQSESVAE